MVALDERRTVTPREYAELMGCHLGTAYNRLWKGQVEARRYLGRWLIFLPQEAKAEPENKFEQEEALR